MHLPPVSDDAAGCRMAHLGAAADDPLYAAVSESRRTGMKHRLPCSTQRITSL